MKERRIGRYVRRYRNFRPRWVLGVGALGVAAEAAGHQLLILAESIEDAFVDVPVPCLSALLPHAPGPGAERSAVGGEVAGRVPAPISEVGRQVLDEEFGGEVEEGVGLRAHAPYVCGKPTHPAASRGDHLQLVIIDETQFYPQPEEEAESND